LSLLRDLDALAGGQLVQSGGITGAKRLQAARNKVNVTHNQGSSLKTGKADRLSCLMVLEQSDAMSPKDEANMRQK
jgi:hypothetical protein